MFGLGLKGQYPKNDAIIIQKKVNNCDQTVNEFMGSMDSEAYMMNSVGILQMNS